MLRAALDANVYLSAAIRPEGPPGQIIQSLLRDSAFELIASLPIVEEVLRALQYPKVTRYIRTEIDPEAWLTGIVLLGDLVAGDYALSGISRDPGDDKYIAAAVEGRATRLVSGDPDLLDLGQHGSVRIVTPREFLEALRRSRRT